MTTDNFCFYLQNRLIQASQTGGQWYSDNSPFSIPCTIYRCEGIRSHAGSQHYIFHYITLPHTFLTEICTRSLAAYDD
jgi:hypothetical protein